MITARNYAAQVEYDLLHRQDGRYSGEAKLINQAIHMAIPDNGLILNNDCKGLIGTKSRLPYPVITVECFFVDPRKILVRASNHEDFFKLTSHKSLVLAAENSEKEHICFSAFSHIKEIDEWIPSGFIHKVPCDMERLNPLDYCFSDNIAKDKFHIALSRETIENHIKLCRPMFELLEALSCRNVTTVNFQEASPVNTKRVKDGKLPIYETKMLVIDVKMTPVEYRGYGGSHASPRQHLRRGHIRRHPTAGNIWINSCVVGDADKGVINKQYLVL